MDSESERNQDTFESGKEIAEQINILGDDGVPVPAFWNIMLIFWTVVKLDAVTPMERRVEDNLSAVAGTG